MEAPIRLSPGGAQAALTTAESYVDLSALAGCDVMIFCEEQDIYFSGAPVGTVSGTLVTTGTQTASLTALVADRVGVGVKVVRRVDRNYPVLVVKTVTSTGTLKVKVVTPKEAR